MKQLKINVTADNITLIHPVPQITTGEYRITQVAFDFSDEYQGLEVKARFNDIEESVAGNTCFLPMFNKAGVLTIKVFGYRETVVNDETIKELVYSPAPTKLSIELGSYDGTAGSSAPIPPADTGCATKSKLWNGFKEVYLQIENPPATAQAIYEAVESGIDGMTLQEVYADIVKIGNILYFLVSGENIKTINNQSILGGGNIEIQGGGGSVQTDFGILGDGTEENPLNVDESVIATVQFVVETIESYGFVTNDELTERLSSYALSSDIPTKTSDLTNDSGFVNNSDLTTFFNEHKSELKGEQGPQGEQGPTGENGMDGATWYSGANPSSVAAKENDFYLLTTDYSVFSAYDVLKYEESQWNYLCNIKGADGEDGTSPDTSMFVTNAALQSTGYLTAATLIDALPIYDGGVS